MFPQKPKVGLSALPLSPDLLEGLRTEADLQNCFRSLLVVDHDDDHGENDDDEEADHSEQDDDHDDEFLQEDNLDNTICRMQAEAEDTEAATRLVPQAIDRQIRYDSLLLLLLCSHCCCCSAAAAALPLLLLLCC